MKPAKLTKPNPNTCGCCEGVDALTPVAIFNRPGLDALIYRAGTHGSFLETMKARLSSSDFPMLAALTTRDGSDAAIALLDAWATVADVLTFYQERIANEGYLRTAIERRSILELARLVGYRLRPGLAASVYLAYTLEPTQETTIIEPGNKAQSIPGPNELPQVFETAEKLVAHSGLNLIKPRMTQPQFFNSPGAALNNPQIILKGASANLRVNDALLLDFTTIGSGVPQSLTKFYRVTEITPDPALNRTSVKLSFQGTPTFGVLAPPPVAPAAALINAVRTIAEKYLDIEAFGLSEKSKIVTRVRDRLTTLKTISASADNDDEKATALAGEMPTLLPQLTDEYALSSARGYDKIASWLEAMKDELEALQNAATPPITIGASTHVAASTSNQASFDDFDDGIPVPTGLPSFVELFRPFKQPQSLQPRNEARLPRQVGQIYAERSEFVAQLYATLHPQAAPFIKAALANAAAIQAPTPSPRTAGVVELTQVQALRQKAALAGHKFPTIFFQTTEGNTTQLQPLSPPTHRDYEAALSAAGALTESPTEGLSTLALDAEYDQIKVGDQIAIVRPTLGVTTVGTTASVHTVMTQPAPAQLTFSQATVKVTVLKLAPAWLNASERNAALTSNILTRNTTAYVQGEKLPHIESAIESAIGPTADDPTPLIELDTFYPSLETGRWIILSGERVVPGINPGEVINTGVRVSELVMVASVQHEAKTLVNKELVEVKGEKLHTFIRPAQTPAYSYKRDTVKIYGNVVRATQGETRNEVLGSGDGSQTLQSFALRQPPLTYLAAPTPSGVQTTLEVRVNDIRWRESENLFALGRNDRGYITKIDDGGKTTVIFGNGEQGARLPTGVENVKAVYRSGIGKVGNVKAEQIKLPMTKPLGVKGVINPLPASGGADKETGDQARRNAPIATMALDRLVSVQDYADFARTFAGIAKASALRLSDGARQIVHLTIAGAGNIPIDPTSDLYRNLVDALKRFGDPFQPFQVEVFERALLVVSAKVSLHPDYLWESVKPKIREALLDKFGFERRELGQDLTQSEALSVIQSVAGVNYVDLELLDSVDEQKLNTANFAASLTLRPRVKAELAETAAERNKKKGQVALSRNAANGAITGATASDANDILPAQLVFLSADATDTLILEEVGG